MTHQGLREIHDLLLLDSFQWHVHRPPTIETLRSPCSIFRECRPRRPHQIGTLSHPVMTAVASTRDIPFRLSASVDGPRNARPDHRGVTDRHLTGALRYAESVAKFLGRGPPPGEPRSMVPKCCGRCRVLRTTLIGNACTSGRDSSHVEPGSLPLDGPKMFGLHSRIWWFIRRFEIAVKQRAHHRLVVGDDIVSDPHRVNEQLLVIHNFIHQTDKQRPLGVNKIARRAHLTRIAKSHRLGQ